MLMTACGLNSSFPIFALLPVRGCRPIGFKTDAKLWRGVERIAAMIAGNAGRGQKLLAIFLFFAAASAFAGLLFGSVHIPADTVARALLSSSDGKDNVAHQIVWQLRLPRILAAFACGGLLALAGVLLQVLLRNPLADPYILGVSGGRR